MMYYGPYSDNLSTFTLLKQIAQIPQNLLLARVKVKSSYHRAAGGRSSKCRIFMGNNREFRNSC